VTVSSSGKSTPPTAAQKRLAAQRSAAARERIAATQRRRRLWTVISAVGAVLAVVVALIVVKLVTGAGEPTSGKGAAAAPAGVRRAIVSVPASAFDAAAGQSGTVPPKAVQNSTALTADGKPQVLFIGAEFCPYCAAERWPLAVALARFGTLHNLGETTSSASDVYPSTATLSFHGTTYSSDYISFTGKEAQSNIVDGNSYAPLDKVSPADRALWKQIGNDSYPFLDIGGTWMSLQASYDPQLLHGLTHAQIAADLADSTSTVGRTILASANQLTAAICTLTDNKPAGVCTSSGVTSAAAKLGNG
jgi:hypothetical protein